MVLVEILANSWSTYRMGFTNSIQHNDFDSAILFATCMKALLPKGAQPVLDPIPTARDVREDYALKMRKWDWVVKTMPEVETKISQWVHANMNRV